MPVLKQYIFQSWHCTDVQYRASTGGQLLAKLLFGAAPVVYASTMPVPRLLRYWYGTKPVVNSHPGQGGKVGFMPVFTNGTVPRQL